MLRPIRSMAVVVLALAAVSCGGGDEGGSTNNGTGGADAGDDGSVGGTSGSGGGGTGGSGGTSVGGSAGGGGLAGNGGLAGAAGSGGLAGGGGVAGSGGAAGSGTGGAAGSGGVAGAGGAAGSGTGGAAGAGTGGTGGSAFDPTCYMCHGTTGSPTPAPPKDTTGKTATTDKGVGAHQSHLTPANWHAPITCDQCHLVPKTVSDPGHIDTTLPAEVLWDTTDLARADNANPSWGGTTCNGVYCHGATLMGSGTNTTPTWTTVDGSQKACGTCHSLPPGGTHPSSTNCPQCHGAVIASFTPGTTPSATWTDPNKHINGTVEVTGGLTCTSCHGNASTSDPSPPLGANGETQTSQPAVGAHQQHLGTANWHKQVVCADCHTLPTSTSHSNGTDDFTWSALATGSGSTTPAYSSSNYTCSDVYCHGSSLMGPISGGSTKTSPVWNTVDGTYDACGGSCHTNPPGGTHLPKTNCPACHSAVITTYTPGSPSTNVWADAQKHVNGSVEVSMTCTSCHGTSPSQINPPVGVAGETTTNTLAVGRHVAHLTASNTHVAFACGTCHVVPGAGDTAHAAQYVASANLSTAGHHGDVTFSAPATGMTWNVNATQGNPVTARGTCIGACHSNGRGGNPVVIPYWAGGNWNTGSCGSCHQATPQTGEHNKHVNGENLACTVCHPGANTSTHMNGQWDVKTTITGPNGGSVTTTPPASANCNGDYRCAGTCHGENHSTCW